jgi:hypothetical protein
VPRSLAVIAALSLLVAVGCASGATAPATPSPPSAATAVNTCARAHRSRHLAYLVVQHLSGQTIERCAGFDGETIAGDTVMKATGIQFEAIGDTVCQIDHEPQLAGGCSTEQAHWVLWHYTAGAWRVSTVGLGGLQLHDHDAVGWRYVPSASPSPSPPIAPQPL